VSLTLFYPESPSFLLWRGSSLTMHRTRASIPHHTLWTTAVSRYWARRKARKRAEKETKLRAADKDGAISFENEIVT